MPSDGGRVYPIDRIDESSRGPYHSSMTTPPVRTPGHTQYGALADVLRARIVAGEWRPGAALPAEQSLAAKHGVALGTLRHALELLSGEGLIERSHGRGTFVKAGLAGAPMLRFFRFGQADEVPGSRILSRQLRRAPAGPAHALGLAAGDTAFQLKRLRSFGSRPCLVEDIWLPLPAFAALVEGDAADWGDLLYPLFAERCGIHVHRAVDSIGFGVLPAAAARTLRLDAGHPCAVVTRQAYDLAGRCIEYRTTRGDAHAFHYTVSIS
jgi:GntR family transcriptional regulator